MLKSNPCVSCGACCAYFRVSFHWSETESGPAVPIEFTDDLNDFRRCMTGTNQEKPRCIQFQGDIGKEVKCGIYENRPSPCRRFGVQWKEGEASITERDFIHCNRARHFWGLKRLTRRRLHIIPPDLKPGKIGTETE